MGVRDRFYTPATARAIVSWRLAVGAVAAVGAGLLGVPWIAAVAGGVVVYAALVWRAMPKVAARPSIDPFTLGEPWRHIVRDAQGASRKLRATIAGAEAGPLRDRLDTIASELERGLAELWKVARRGDEIDHTVRRLDPTRLRSNLGTLHGQHAAAPSPETTAAIESVERQLASADRLAAQSNDTATRLRLHQTRLDELVARAAEVRIGAAPADTYARDVDDLVVQLEALQLAVGETDGGAAAPSSP